MEMLYREAFAGLTWLQVGGAALALVAVVMLIGKFTGKKERGGHKVGATCSCGWSGQVSRHQKRCPKCNSGLL